MTAKVTLRPLTDQEQPAIATRAQARTAPARRVDRARIIQAAAQGPSPGPSAARLGCSRPTVSAWIRRFNDQGLPGLEERPRSGRPHTDTVEQRAEVLATALTDPKSLGLPFGCGTWDRWPADLNEPKGIPIKRSRSDEILLDEGLCGRKQEPWCGARGDPEFTEQRGSSRHSTRHRRKAAAASAATRWAPRVPRASRDSSASTPHRRRTPRGRPSPPNGPNKRSTPGDAARGPSSGRSARRPARR